MKLKKFCDCDSCDKWVSKKLNNGDFDYYLVVTLGDLKDVQETGDFRYYCDIAAISITEGTEHLNKAINCCGIADLTDQSTGTEKTLLQIEALDVYGIRASLWSRQGNNKTILLAKARKELAIIPHVFGFYMDQQQNILGATGWDVIQGNIGWSKNGLV